ncbi:MAG: NADH-quinone oxidoreductase subunit L [Planctomycetia bacterium]|nr:NADH-quinone oxidoreductase subunit L [Planctomycetia bacterium]
MSEPISLALVILVLPLAAALLTASWSGEILKKAAHWPLIISCAVSTVLAFLLVGQVTDFATGRIISSPVTWFAAGKLKVNFTITIDALSATMLAMITFVSTMIAVFSSGYMRGDKGYARFFAVMSVFVFSMCGLVLANNFILLVAFWEGVGLCSYLLVGYYFEKPSAAAAARKAFLVTRLGDTGFLLGIFLLWRMGGWHTDLTALFDHIQKNPPDQGTLTTACLLLFCGAVGKSAQFPLYVWLPDAMEGPTPVSALIHAATMVTAGVYLLARCAPLFALSPDAQITVAWIGGLTALLAAFIALAQTDLKRILAYSTVSQLGYMFLALGTCGAISPTFAVTAAMFHLFTHAFFKALLFLSAGSVMHAMGGVIDVRYFRGLRKRLPVTHITFLCGAAALAGVPLLSGFWSKDLILESLTEASESNSPYTAGYFTLLLLAFFTAFLTAFYTFRAYFLTFWGEEKIPEEAGHHLNGAKGGVHESPSVMTLPLIVLAAGALLVGIVLEPFTHWFSDFLGTTPSLGQVRTPSAVSVKGEEHHFNWTIAIISSVFALGGIGLAAVMYRKGEEKLPAGLEPVFTLSRNKLYVDDIYYAVLVKPAEVLAFLARVFDGFLDALSRLVAAIPRFIGQWIRPIQNGLVQFYALWMAMGLAVFLSFVFRITR